MKTSKKIRIFALVSVCLMLLLSISAFAAEKLDQNMSGADMTIGERIEYALQGSATGMLMVFAVLTLLAVIVSLAGKILGPKQAKPAKAEKKETNATAVEQIVPAAPKAVAQEQSVVASVEDEGAVLAAITAAISVMIENGEYKNEFVGGFRVVSFKRSNSGAWNRK